MTTFHLPINSQGYVTIIPALRERHLTPDVKEATCQAIGTHLQILIESERDDLLVRVPLEDWVLEQPYGRKMNQHAVHCGRWRDALPIEERGDREYVEARASVVQTASPDGVEA